MALPSADVLSFLECDSDTVPPLTVSSSPARSETSMRMKKRKSSSPLPSAEERDHAGKPTRSLNEGDASDTLAHNRGSRPLKRRRTDVSEPARHITTVSFTIKREETCSPSLSWSLPEAPEQSTTACSFEFEAVSPIHTPRASFAPEFASIPLEQQSTPLYMPAPLAVPSIDFSLLSTLLEEDTVTASVPEIPNDYESCARAAAFTQELIEGYLSSVEAMMIGAF